MAERYDESAADMFEPAAVDPVVDFLADLAGHGAALELGIGTGRIALPLTQSGVRVHGIDLSAAMVAIRRAKPGAENIGVTIGDFATTTVEGTFSGITVNTIAPGFIPVERLADVPEETRAHYVASVPAGRFGTPAELAHAVAFFASEDAGIDHRTTGRGRRRPQSCLAPRDPMAVANHTQT